MPTGKFRGFARIAVPVVVLGWAADARAFTFSIERAGKPLGFFQTCRGLGSSTEVIEFREGAGDAVRKLPGRQNVGDVICTRGLTSSAELTAWRKLVEDGKIAEARSSVTVTLYDEALTPVARWELGNAWPSELQALGTQTAAAESVTIVCESIQRVPL